MCSRVKCHHAAFIIVVVFSLSRATSIRFDGRMAHPYRRVLGFANPLCAFTSGEFSVVFLASRFSLPSPSPSISLSLVFFRFLSHRHCLNPPRDAYTYFYASFLSCRHHFRASFRTLSPCRIDYYVPRNGSDVASSRRAVTDHRRDRPIWLKKESPRQVL